MSKDKIQLLSPLFLKYQADFEKNPRSRVFAPLAETYRKLGMTDKAMEILSQGIRYNPSYLMGYLGLAFCYYDLKQFNLAYSTLRALVETNRDNIRLQKLFSDICLELGKKEEALETLKYLLFINPRDKDISVLVQKIEKEVDDKYKPQHKPIIISENEFSENNEVFDLEKLNKSDNTERNDFDDWMTVDLSQDSTANTSSSIINKPEIKNYDHWNIKKINEPKSLAKEELDEQADYNSDRNYKVQLDLENDSDPLIEAALKDTYKAPYIEQVVKTEIQYNRQMHVSNNDMPLVTHTLVDLYCGQGHIEKALEAFDYVKKFLEMKRHDLNVLKEAESKRGNYE